MAFVKLDCGILRSTLWMDRVSREVFITALLMAEPREFESEVDQIEVQTLSLTGFKIPPGWYGFIDAAGVGIVRMALVDSAEGMAALERLCNPEPESRSAEFDGRRMARVNGGYVVLNYMKYRDRDHTSAVRSQRYRERKKKEASRVTSTPSRRDITYAEANAEAKLLKSATKVADRREEAKTLWPRVVAAIQYDDLRKSFPEDGDVQKAVKEIGGWTKLGLKKRDLRGQTEQAFLNAYAGL